MKFRILAVAAVAAAALFGGLAHATEPSDACGAPVANGIGITNSGDPTTGAGSIAVCNDGSTVPIGGAVTLSGDANTQQGSLTVDGNSSNPGCLAGFVHVDFGNQTVTSAPSGDYSADNTGTTPDPQQVISDCAPA